MKACPNCGGALQKGYVRTGQRICWKNHEFYGFNLPEKEDGEFFLRGSGLWDGSSCPGYYCSDCELILLPQKEDEEL